MGKYFCILQLDKLVNLSNYKTIIYHSKRFFAPVGVIGSLKQKTGSKEISKWLERKGTIKQQSIQQWTLNLNWSDKKVKTRNLLGCFEINSMFRTSVHGFLPDLSRVYNMVRVHRG